MLDVASDLCWVPAKFENPVNNCSTDNIRDPEEFDLQFNDGQHGRFLYSKQVDSVRHMIEMQWLVYHCSQSLQRAFSERFCI